MHNVRVLSLLKNTTQNKNWCNYHSLTPRVQKADIKNEKKSLK